MNDYSWLVRELRKAEDFATMDGTIPAGLIYRLSQAADAIEEQAKEIQNLSDVIKRAYRVINSLIPSEEET